MSEKMTLGEQIKFLDIEIASQAATGKDTVALESIRSVLRWMEPRQELIRAFCNPEPLSPDGGDATQEIVTRTSEDGK